jgi:hypothetical protein
MATSEARILANRANALKSSGPKTEQGKEISRANALKHGLTGQGIVLASEDIARVQQRLDGLQAACRPATEAGRSLVRRAALLSIRIERCEVHEAAALSTKIRSAEADFDEARDAEVEHLMDTIGDNPALSLRRLMRMPEGVDRLVETWNGLREDLEHGDGARWGAEHGAMALNLTGRKAGGFGIARVEALSKAVGGDFSLLSQKDGANLDPKARREWARNALAGLIGEQVAGLEAHRETLDFEAIAADRADATSRALFDPSKEACLARKYEAAAVRELHRTLKELREVEAQVSRALESPSPAQDPLRAWALGSFSPGAMDRPAPPPPAPSKAPEAPRNVVSAGYSSIPFAVGRAPIGSA